MPVFVHTMHIFVLISNFPSIKATSSQYLGLAHNLLMKTQMYMPEQMSVRYEMERPL